MELNLRDDPDTLFSYARLKKYGKISSRLRAIALHANNESIEEIVDRLGYCRQTICEWIHRYNANGINGLFDLPRPGQPKQLSAEDELIFKKRIIDGAKDTDEISAFTGKSICNILQNEFHTEYSLSGVYNLLRRLKLSSLLPRPRHEKNNPEEMKKWEIELPSIVDEVKKNPEKEIILTFQDESRYGQKTQRTRVWAETNSRPIMIKQLGYKNAYMFGVINPMNGDSFGMINTHVGEDFMQMFLDQYSLQLKQNQHAIMIMDGAGWHHAKSLIISENITLHFLPAYCPELNPIERLWKWIKEHHLAFKIYKTCDEILEAGFQAWKKINPEIIRSVCASRLVKQILLGN